MIEIKDLIKNTLQSLNIPVCFQRYLGKETTYITFSEYVGQGEEWAENKEIATGHYIQIDVWSKSDYASIVNQSKELLISAGFKRTYETELYENDTQIFHKVLRVFYLEEI